MTITRIFLIGYMGAGKTTLGKALARELNLSFLDLDWYMEERFHKTVREIFVEKGEEQFRKLEQQMLHEVSEFENIVISTGGGTPCFLGNMEYMAGKGKCVFLDVTVETLFKRLKVAKMSRPLLMDKSDDELRDFITTGLTSRLSYYTQAEYQLAADELESKGEIKETVNKLIELLQIK